MCMFLTGLCKICCKMPSRILPPSPNWYCSRASDTSQDGVLAFATKNSVFLLNTKTNPPCGEGCLQGHVERITGVSFCQTADQTQQCATSSDDSMVKVWDVKTKTVVKEHKVHQYKVTNVHWSPLQKDLIVSGDEKGALVCWNLSNNDSKLFIPESNYIFSLACSPHNAAHVAVGYKNALVLLIDINNKGTILQRLRGHEDEVQSICWAPCSVEISSTHKPSHAADEDNWRENSDHKGQGEDEHDDHILLSGSKDRTIRVWSTEDGKCVQTLRLPPKGFQRSREKGDDRGNRVWVALWWIQNEKASFISSSHSGDVLRWDLSGSKPKWEYLGSYDGSGINLHMRVVFNISQGPTPDTVITTSMDRKIICWNSNTLQPEWCLSSLGGFVYCIAASPLDQSRLALGVGDSMIRVWNTSSPGQDCDVTTLWQGIKAKVTAVCWHPSRENCLAYGTDEGKIGIYNNMSHSNKPPALSSTYHRKTVYALSWGPPCPAKSDNNSGLLHLYTCGGEGVILQHDPTSLQQDAVNVNKLIRETNNIEHMMPQRTEVSWCPDGRAVAMGNEDGSIDIFSAPSLLLLCTIHVHHKLINCLKWYPLSGLHTDQSQTGTESASQSDLSTVNGGVESSQSEQQRYWLASGSNDPHVHVYDLNKVLGPKEPIQLDTPLTSSMCCLSGHTLRVTALSWSPHGDSRLVSASYDGTAQVWDVLKGEPLYNYRGHLGRVFACLWSALEEDAIYTGSDDFTVRKWKLTECENKQPPKKKREALGKTTRFQSGDAKSKKGKKQNKKKNAQAKSPETTSSNKGHTKSKEEALKSSDQSGGLAQKTETNKEAMSQPQALSQAEQGQEKEIKCEKQEEVRVVNKMGEAESSYLEEAAEAPKDLSYQKIRKEKVKKKKTKSLFPISCGLDNRAKSYRQTDCVQLAATKYGHTSAEEQSKQKDGTCNTAKSTADCEDNETTHLGFFSNKKAMYDTFRDEADNHAESGYFEQKCMLGLWKGNVLVELEEAKQSGNLTDMMVAMASVGGPDVWLEICEAYAQQLEQRDDFIKAAHYYIACHQVHKAIQVLMNNRFHREAAAVAMVRLPEKDPLLIEVYTSWASQLEKEGSFEQAAKCFLAVDQPADAIRLLCKKGDPSALRAGLEVAILAEQETMVTRLMARYVNECMLTFDWSQAQQVVSNHEALQAGQLLLNIHETIAASWVADEIISAAWYEEPLWSPWQQVVTLAEKQVLDNLSSWTTSVVDDTPLLQAAITIWAKEHHVDLSDKDLISRLYNRIDKTKPQGFGQNMVTKQLLIYLFNEVVLGQLSLLMGNVHDAASHWLQALDKCHSIGEYDIAKGLLTLLLPKGRESFEKLRCKNFMDHTSQHGLESSKVTETVLSCLEEYYSLTVLYHLWWNFGSRNQELSKSSELSISEAKAANSTSRNTALKSDDIVSSHDSTADVNKESSASSEQKSVNDNGDSRRTRTSEQGQSAALANRTNSISLLSKLEYLSDALLSDVHAKYFQLQHKLTAIQQDVARLVAKHKEDETVARGTGDDVSSEGADVDAVRTSNDTNATGGISETTAKLQKQSTARAEDRINHTSSEGGTATSGGTIEGGVAKGDTDFTEGGANLLELTASLNTTLKEIDQIKAEVKDHPFPEPLSSAFTIAFFTRQAAKCDHKEVQSQLLDLCSKTAAWGHQNSFTEENKCRFSKYLKPVH